MPDKHEEDTSTDEEVCFQWVGRKLRSENNQSFYESCSVNDDLFKIGDNVIIKGENNVLYSASILSLYEDPTMADPNRARVSWYFGLKELPSRSKKLIKNFVIHDKELFQPLPDKNDVDINFSVEDVDAETFESHCTIKQLGKDEKIPNRLEENEYIVRYGFTKKGELFAVSEYMQGMKSSKKSTDISSKEKTPHIDAKPSKEQNGYKNEKMKKRKAGKSLAEAENDIVIAKKNRLKSESKENIQKSKKETAQTKAFNASEALGQLLDSDGEESEVFVNSSDDDASSIQDDDKSKGTNHSEVASSNRHIQKGISDIPTRSKIATPKSETRYKSSKTEVLANLAVSAASANVRRRTLRTRTPQQNILINDDFRPGTSENQESFNVTPNRSSRILTDDTDEDADYVPDEDKDEDVHDHVASHESEDEEIQSEPDVEDSPVGIPKKQRRKKSINYKGSSKKTPKTPRLSANIKTPKTIGKRNMTPSISERRLPCATPRTPLEQARQRLHVSALPDSLPCREQEFADIYSFIEGKLTSDMGGDMILSPNLYYHVDDT